MITFMDITFIAFSMKGWRKLVGLARIQMRDMWNTYQR
jgi:hypothetical protein